MDQKWLKNRHLRSPIFISPGQAPAALESIREAVAIRRHLAQRLPDRFLSDLAQSLGTLGTVLRALNRLPDAQAAFREGIDLIEPFARQFREGPAARLLTALEQSLRTTQDPPV